jgi:hypothetical protein
LLLLGDRAFLTFDEKIDYTIYREFSSQNYLNQTGTARLTIPRRRFGFFTEVGLLQREDRPNSELDARPERRESRFGAGIILRLGWRSYAEVEQMLSKWSHSDPDFLSSSGLTIDELLDRHERGTQFRLGYRLTDRTKLTFETSNKEIDFDNAATNRDSREWRWLPGIEFGEGGRLRGVFRIGHSRIDARDPAQPDYSGLVGEARLAYWLGSDTTVSVNGRREVGFAVYQGNLYLLDRTAGARVVHYLNRAVGVEAGFSRGTLTFPGAASANDRQDQVREYEIGLRLRISENALGRRVEYSLKARRYERDSTVASLDQSRTTLGVAAVVGF